MASGDSAFDGPLAPATVKGSDTAENGVVLLAVEVEKGGESSDREPTYSVPGDIWRPLDPTDDGAAEAVCARASDGLPILAARDLRVDLAAATPIEKGTRRIAWYRGAQISFSVAPSGTGTVLQFYVPFDHDGDGVPGKGHVITLDPVEGAITILAASGAGITLASDGSATIKSGNGENFASVTDDGVTLSGDLRVGNSNLVVGDPALAQDVALAQPSADFNSPVGQAVLLLITAVNTLSAGSVPPTLVTQITAALAPYLAPGQPTTRAPRILGQPGP